MRPSSTSWNKVPSATMSTSMSATTKSEVETQQH